MNTKNYITLKWGTLKSWGFETEKARPLLEEYTKLGTAASAISQKDTARQKEIICELIDLCDGDTIYLEWDGVDVTKPEAKKYVLNFSSEL